MLAGVISKWGFSAGGDGRDYSMVLLPSNIQKDRGQMLEIVNMLYWMPHGLSLKDGRLNSHFKIQRISDREFRLFGDEDAVSQSDFDVSDRFNYITSIREYLSWVETCNTRASGRIPLFRGHESASYSFTTTFERFYELQENQALEDTYGIKQQESFTPNNIDDFANHLVKSIYNREQEWRSALFRALLGDFIAQTPERISDFNPLEWLAYARHSGLPVPVLDFTKNPLVALYFALSFSPPNPNRETDAAVYSIYASRGAQGTRDGFLSAIGSPGHAPGRSVRIIHPKFRGSSSAEHIVDQIAQMRTGILLSPRSTASAWLQKSYFLVLPISEIKQFAERKFALSHCFIRDSDRRRILKELMMLGIDETLVFDDSKALAKAITQHYSLSTHFFSKKA